MQNFAIKKGSEILYHQKPASIVAAEQQCIVIAINDALETLTPSEYYEKINQGLITPPTAEVVVAECVPRLTYEEREQSHKYQAYFKALDDEVTPYSTTTVKQVIEVISDKRGDIGKDKPKVDTLKGWYRKYNSDRIGRNIIKMVKPKSAPRTSQFSEAMIDTFYEVLDEEYLHFNGRTAQETFFKFRSKVAQLILSMPKKYRKLEKIIKRSTFYEYIRELDPVQVFIARNGWTAAQHEFRFMKEHIVATRPLEHVQIDAVHINLGLTDEAGRYVGMPVVYFAIDVFTCAILAYVISYAKVRAEEGIAAIELLKRIIRPKEKPDYCKNGYPLFGKPEQLRHDSGVFAGTLCEDYLTHMQIHDITSEAKKPWRNAIVERFNRTYREQCCNYIVGYVGKRTTEYKDSASVQTLAVCKVDEFVQITETFILDVYHQNPHRGLDGLSPAQMAKKYGNLVEVPSPEYLARLDSFIGFEFTPAIQKIKGIEKDGLFYHTKKLMLIRAKLEKSRQTKTISITAFRNTLDISKISVLDPYTGQQFPVTCTSIKEPISLAEYKALKGKSKKISSATSRKTIETSTTIIGDLEQRAKNKQKAKDDVKNEARKSKDKTEAAYFLKDEELNEIVGMFSRNEESNELDDGQTKTTPKPRTKKVQPLTKLLGDN